jgi:hypothetical protein
MSTLKAIQDEVRRILLKEWDPIGIVDVPQAADEYDSYSLQLTSSIVAGVSVDALADRLMAIETGQMGLKPNRSRAERVASLLLATRAN